jgi:hypothetical protein
MSKHRWGEPDREDPRLTLRVCIHCGMRRLTHHDPGRRPFVTFASKEGAAYHGEGTPKCFAIKATAA